MMAAEMAVIRLTHVADLPDPETLVKKLQSQPAPPPSPGGGVPGGAPAGGNYGGTVHRPMMAAPQTPARGPTMMGGQATALAEDDDCEDLGRASLDSYGHNMYAKDLCGLTTPRRPRTLPFNVPWPVPSCV
jgi:hypothetical protein